MLKNIEKQNKKLKNQQFSNKTQMCSIFGRFFVLSKYHLQLENNVFMFIRTFSFY